MKRAPQAARIGYFGKLPSRADFIKAADNLALANLLDDWLAEVMNLLSADPRWKINYDAMGPVNFAFTGTRSRRAIAGRLIASSDSSQRRYPFLAMSAFEVEAPAVFIPQSPLVLAQLWDTLELCTADVMSAAAPEAALRALSAISIEVDPSSRQYEQTFLDFLNTHDISTLEAMLSQTSVRRKILAIGLLLQPVRRSGAERLDKSMVLPLPARNRNEVAAFWLDLVTPFLRRSDFELSLFFADQRQHPALIIGFSGAAPESLAALIDPNSAVEHQISFEYAGWVDELIAGDPKVQKLSAYLEQGRLSLRSVRALFHETFD